MNHPGTILAARVGEENNLNALRLFLALLVIFAHSFPLTLGFDATPQFTYGYGETAVNLFFFISGILITASWLRSKSMSDYLRKRILRIYPGFIAAMLFSTCVMIIANPALAATELSFTGFKNFLEGCVALSPGTLSGDAVFPHNPLPHAANTSLWTIALEFQCYLLVAVIGIFCLLKHRWLVLGFFVCSYLLLCKGLWLGLDVGHMDRRFLTYFFAGMCTWLWRDKIPLHWSLAVAALGLMFWPLPGRLSSQFAAPFSLMYLALWIGYAQPLTFTRWCDKTDLSYGVYLYAFPIQQLIAKYAHARNPWLMLSLAAPLSLMVAFASWHLVEKRFLRMKASSFVDRDPAVPLSDTPTALGQLEQAL